MKKANIGLVGLGNMGKNHARVLSSMANVKLSHVWDINESHANDIGLVYGAMVKNFDEMLDEIDAIVVASPTSTHYDYLKRIIGRVKYIFIEKPLVENVVEAEEVRALAVENETIIQVGFIERFNPAVVGAKRTVTQNSFHIDFHRTNKLSSRITDVDVVLDLMIHDIDLALHFNGEVDNVSSKGFVDKHGHISFAVATLKHLNGNISRILSSRVTDKKLRRIEISSSQGFLEVNLLSKEIVLDTQSVTNPEDRNFRVTSQRQYIEVGHEEALRLELECFVGVIQGSNKIYFPDINDGINSLRIVEKIKKEILEDAELKK